MSAASESLVLALAGDVHLGDEGFSLDAPTRAFLAAADLVLVNVESPLTNRGSPRAGKRTPLRSRPETVRTLESMHVAVGCLANNHLTDYGVEGVRQTIEVLRSRGMICVGAGENATEAERLAVVERKGLRVGIASLSHPDIQSVPAGPDAPGVAALVPDRCLAQVPVWRQQCDLLVVALHWGFTNYHFPVPEHVELGRRLIEAGAAVVAGHHPHVVQGVLRHRNGVVCFSLGNFMFAPFRRGGRPAYLSAENRRGVLAGVRVGTQGVLDLGLTYTEQAGLPGGISCVAPPTQARREQFLARLSLPLSSPHYPRAYRWYLLRRLIQRGLATMSPARIRELTPERLRGVQVALRELFRRRRKG